MKNRIVILGGCGFIGSNIALFLRDFYSEIIVIDNFSRVGSELNKSMLESIGIKIFHNSVENLSCFELFGSAKGKTTIIDCAANPAVGAGYNDSIASLYKDNVLGLAHVLDLCKKRDVKLIFISSSRILPLKFLQSIKLQTNSGRFSPTAGQDFIDSRNQIEPWGIELGGRLSFYGQTKLASEKIILEHSISNDFSFTIFRPGVISGPGQFGKAEQGFVSLWLKSHLKKSKLTYKGYGGLGHQVRDILHVNDFCIAVKMAIENDKFTNETFWLGGGIENSISLKELTDQVANLTGNKIEICSSYTNSDVDAPYVVFSNKRVTYETGWKPAKNINTILLDQINFFKSNPLYLEVK